MFGDWSWMSHRTEAQHERFNGWLHELAKSSANLAVIELGAGSAIPTVRHASERVLESIDGTLIRINRERTAFPAARLGCRSALRREFRGFVSMLNEAPNAPNSPLEAAAWHPK